MFLAPFDGEGAAENEALGTQGITSITLDTLVTDTATGVYSDMEADAFVVCFSDGTLIETDLAQKQAARKIVHAAAQTQLMQRHSHNQRNVYSSQGTHAINAPIVSSNVSSDAAPCFDLAKETLYQG